MEECSKSSCVDRFCESPCRAAAETRRACQSQSPRVPRRSRAGVAVPQACGAATRTGSCPGPPRLQPEPQGRRRAGRGRDGLQTPSLGGAAHGASTLGTDAAKALLGRSTDQDWSQCAISTNTPLPDLSNFSPLLGSRLWKAGIPARDVRQTLRPPCRSAQPIRDAPDC